MIIYDSACKCTEKKYRKALIFSCFFSPIQIDMYIYIFIFIHLVLFVFLFPHFLV